MYPDFTPFTNDALRQHISIYMIQGLDPAPQVSMKFKSQQEDDINGNDFINRPLGPGAVRRHKHFRRFFATQCPVKASPSRSSRPNWKIDPFLAWINSISKKAWRLGKIISTELILQIKYAAPIVSIIGCAILSGGTQYFGGVCRC